MLIDNIKKSGGTILEALVSSFVIAVAALAYGNLQIQGFTQILSNQRLEQASAIASDFSSVMMLSISNRETDAEKDDEVLNYINLIWNITPAICETTPTYISDCQNIDLDDDAVCSPDKIIQVNKFETSCDVFNVAPTANFNLDYCNNSGSTSLCFWINIDGTNRNENNCRDNPNNCVLMEIKI